MWISGWNSPNVSYYSAKFGSHRYFVSLDVIFSSFVTWPHNQKITWLWSWGPSIASYYSIKFGGHGYCGFTFATWTRGQNFTWLGMWGLPKVSYQPAKFHGHRYCGSADISFFHFPLVHLIWSKDHVTLKGFLPPPQVATLPCLVAIDVAEVQI